jgi:C-terminal processing protease CtpA/Prc
MKYTQVPLLLLFVLIPTFAISQEPEKPKKTTGETKRFRSDAVAMLDEMKGALKEHYYDAKFRGINLDERFAAAKERVRTLDYNWQIYRVLVQVLMELNDSHTNFRVPPRTDFFDYGFSMQMIGNDCFVVSVKKDSDAEKKGLAVGQKILGVGRWAPTRDNLWKLVYLMYKLDPSRAVELEIETVDGTQKKITVEGKTMTQKERSAELKSKKTKQKEQPFKCSKLSETVIACKLHTFMTDKGQIDKMMKEVAPHQKLILDLRGNPGGYVLTEEHFIGQFFPNDVKIAEVVSRKKTEVRMARGRGDKAYRGELFVLVDSRSASAAEMFARVMQIEKRGRVIGDVSAGAVMTSIYVPLFSQASAFADIVWSKVGMSVTVADVIMKDGGRLEHVGVKPDIPLIPTGVALSKKVDVILAYAAYGFGVELSPEDAGKLAFLTERSDDEDLDVDEP